MLRALSRFRLPLLLAACTAGSGAAWARSLVEYSPFVPPDYQQPGTATPEETGPPPSAAHLQFKGVFSIGGKVKVNLFNTRTNEGQWVPINGQVDGFRVLAYDRETRSVSLDVNGQISHFDLVTVSDTPMAVASAPPGAAVLPPGQPGVPGTPGTPTVRRRTIVPPRVGTTGQNTPGTVRRIPGRNGQRTVVPPQAAGTNNTTQPRAAGQTTTRQDQPYVNPRVINRPGN